MRTSGCAVARTSVGQRVGRDGITRRPAAAHRVAHEARGHDGHRREGARAERQAHRPRDRAASSARRGRPPRAWTPAAGALPPATVGGRHRAGASGHQSSLVARGPRRRSWSSSSSLVVACRRGATLAHVDHLDLGPLGGRRGLVALGDVDDLGLGGGLDVDGLGLDLGDGLGGGRRSRRGGRLLGTAARATIGCPASTGAAAGPKPVAAKPIASTAAAAMLPMRDRESVDHGALRVVGGMPGVSSGPVGRPCGPHESSHRKARTAIARRVAVAGGWGACASWSWKTNPGCRPRSGAC